MRLSIIRNGILFSFRSLFRLLFLLAFDAQSGHWPGPEPPKGDFLAALLAGAESALFQPL